MRGAKPRVVGPLEIARGGLDNSDPERLEDFIMAVERGLDACAARGDSYPFPEPIERAEKARIRLARFRLGG